MRHHYLTYDKFASDFDLSSEIFSAHLCRCYKNAFWFVTLLYPRCAQTSMQMFATQSLDVGTFLKADYSIRTRTANHGISHTYAAYLVLGTVLVILFTVFIPVFYFFVIWKLRFRLQANDFSPLQTIEQVLMFSHFYAQVSCIRAVVLRQTGLSLSLSSAHK